MKPSSTLFLKTVIVLVGLSVLALCVFVLPQAISSELSAGADFDYGPILLGMYLPAPPFFLALHQALKLLNLIDTNKAFSQSSIQALQKIKYCGFVISALYAMGMPYIFYVADRDDAPGIAALGFLIIGASFIIGTAAAVFQHVFQNAIHLKSENDLTV